MEEAGEGLLIHLFFLHAFGINVISENKDDEKEMLEVEKKAMV